ncbi:hypothetical protein WJ70_09215 [Burkholderia ubonensis]|nr:hypothetical protein WJ70_09215 [Burkholderia ubonensis]
MAANAAVLDVITVMQRTPKRLTRFDIIVPRFTKRYVLPPSLCPPGFMGRPLVGPHFPRIFALVNQRFQLAGFDASLTEIPSSSITDRHSDGFAEQPRLKDVGPRAGRSDAQA